MRLSIHHTKGISFPLIIGRESDGEGAAFSLPGNDIDGSMMILHDLPHAFRTADHMILMENGAVAASGTPEEIYATGAVDRIFGIKLGRAHTDDGWRYFCERGI